MNFVQTYLNIIDIVSIQFCSKNKIVYNFHITNPNGMNQSFPCGQKYDL